MKAWIASFLAAGVGFAAAAWLVSSRKEAEWVRRAEALRASLEVSKTTQPASPSKPAAPPDSAAPPARTPSVLAPKPAQEILDKLKSLRVPLGPKRIVAIRQIIHQLENLVDLGPASLPPIREFLSRFEDVDYASDAAREDEDDPLAAETERRAQLMNLRQTLTPSRAPRLDFTSPPSLRLGLVDVLKEIGGEGAEQILIEMLSTSGRGVEIAYVARALQELAPDKHREAAVHAAKELLANLPKIERPNRFDDNAKAYLYGVLAQYGDTSFASAAQNLVINADGHIDRTALNYLTTTLKEQAVPALYQAYKDARLTNLTDRAAIAGQILTYSGANTQANDVFREIVSDSKLPTWLRALTIQSMAGGRGLFANPMPTEAAHLQGRVELLNSLPELNDDRMNKARAETIERLNNRLTRGADAAPDASRTFRERNARPPAPGLVEPQAEATATP